MTFIRLDESRFINTEIIALISLGENDVKIITKNGKEYYIEDNALALRAVQKLELL